MDDAFRKSLDTAAKSLLAKLLQALQHLDASSADLGEIERALRTLVYYDRHRPKLEQMAAGDAQRSPPFRLRIRQTETDAA